MDGAQKMWAMCPNCEVVTGAGPPEPDACCEDCGEPLIAVSKVSGLPETPRRTQSR